MWLHHIQLRSEAVLYLWRARVGRPGEQLIIRELRSRRDTLRRTRAVVNVELAVRVSRHGQQFKQREPILSQLDHAELDQTVGVTDDAPLERDESNRSTSGTAGEMFELSNQTPAHQTHMDFKLPAAHSLICQDFGERDRQAIAEKPLTRLTPHVEP